MPPDDLEDSARSRLGWTEQLRLVASFLTCLPVRAPQPSEPRDLAASAWAFPVIGLGAGAAGGLVYLIAAKLGFTGFLAAVLAVGTQTALTGALHDDGLADVADGFGGGGDRARKLEIMRDSRLGTFGALTLFLATAARIGAIAALAVPEAVLLVLMASGAASRTGIVGLMAFLEPARREGLGASAGTPRRETLYTATAIAVTATLLALGPSGGVLALAATAATLWLLARLAIGQIGGHTGDVLGAGQQVAEITFLIAAVAVL